MVAASSDFVVAVTGSEGCRNGVKLLPWWCFCDGSSAIAVVRTHSWR